MANFHVLAGGSGQLVTPHVRQITFADIGEALRRGAQDFLAAPSHVAFIGLIYPVAGVCLAALTFSGNALPLLYPLVTGFALVGPFAAVGLYEMSRRRELGHEMSWTDALDVLRSPAMPSIIGLGLLLTCILLGWLATAQALYEWLYGPFAPQSYGGFLQEVLTTRRGWTLIVVGNLIGAFYALLVLSISWIAFPLLVHRDVGLAVAVQTSARAFLKNSFMAIAWGVIVAVALALGSVPLLVGLIVVVPVLGHATWHLYRRVIED